VRQLPLGFDEQSASFKNAFYGRAPRSRDPRGKVGKRRENLIVHALLALVDMRQVANRPVHRVIGIASDTASGKHEC